MMKSFLVSTIFLALVNATAITSIAKISYDGYKVLRIQSSPRVKELIQSLGLSTWKGAPKDTGTVDVVVPPSVKDLDEFDAHVMHADLGASITQEAQFEPYVAGAPNQTWFNSYHAYADHLQFLRDLVTAHPNNAEIVTAGNSLQGQPITGIHFYGSSGKGVKPAIVIHGTVHAREWITTMVTEYYAYNLLTNYVSNVEIEGFVNKYDFYIFPVVNPDGFSYTQSTDRLWRKNRQTTSGSTCLGHDINRNWDSHWAVTGGASTDPCADDFKGLAAADAPETKVLAAFNSKLAASAAKLKLFIDYHSYSQLFMTPYGYSCTAVAANNNQLQSLASGAVAAIKAVYGTVFKAGPICTTIYPATGNSVDYANDVTKAQYSFTSELRDTGNYGFVLPANQILPSGVEAYAGLRYLLLNIS